MTGRSARPAGNRIVRLTALDRMFLRDETSARACHFAGLAVVEGKTLIDASRELRLAEITERLDRRLARVPELRRRLHLPGLLKGGPLWVDDDRFDIRYHVRQAAVDPPGEDAQLLEAAARLYVGLLDRRRPLWELWFLTGLSGGRVGVLFKLHHAVADGAAAVAIMGSLFDLEPGAQDPLPNPWRPEPIPGGWSLLADAVSGAMRNVGRGAAWFAQPRRLVGAARVVALVARRSVGDQRAARTSLNQIVRWGRRIGFQRLDLAVMKEVAHAHGGTVNDVVLDLWAGGLRKLLVSRGEPVGGLELTASQAVSIRAATDQTIGNQIGSALVRLPVWELDAARRLDAIVRATRESKARERPAAIMGVLVGLSASPIGRYASLHQRAANVRVTNVVGPPVPMYVFGARILDILPIVRLFGNIGLALSAFSYAGQVSLVVTADAQAVPDLDVLMAGMERDWRTLAVTIVAEPVARTVGGRARRRRGDPVTATR